jgi:hypothetical protein
VAWPWPRCDWLLRDVYVTSVPSCEHARTWKHAVSRLIETKFTDNFIYAIVLHYSMRKLILFYYGYLWVPIPMRFFCGNRIYGRMLFIRFVYTKIVYTNGFYISVYLYVRIYDRIYDSFIWTTLLRCWFSWYDLAFWTCHSGPFIVGPFRKSCRQFQIVKA